MKRALTLPAILTLSVATLSAAILSLSLSSAEEAGTTNVPPDPFGDLAAQKEIPDYSVKVDRDRGSFLLDAKEGQYQPGSHFGNWHWTANSAREGNYYVGLKYDSSRPKLGVQVKIGDIATLKSYAARTNSLSNDKPMILGTAHFPKKGKYPVFLLTGDQSNVPAFKVNGIQFIPAPANEPLGQSIDGMIHLEAKSATTYAEMMRYETKPEKDCLGYWINQEDWAEWKFGVTDPGKFKISITYGCGGGNEGSEIALLANDKTFNFTVEDTGGFQTWKTVDLGTVAFGITGEQKIAIIPQTQAAKGIMDIKEVVLTPVAKAE